jgi:uncharacterized membrane protein
VKEQDETRLSDLIASILRYGVVLSSVTITIGLFLFLLAPPSAAAGALDSMLSSRFGAPTLSASGLLSGVSGGRAVSFLELGMVMLLATPLARVTASVLIFLKERDRTFVGITLLVLGMLLFAIFIIGPSEA